MTGKKDELKKITEDLVQEETERNAQESFKDELNEKLLLSMSDMLDNQNEEITSSDKEQQDTERQSTKRQKTGHQDTKHQKTKNTKASKKKRKIKRGPRIVITLLLGIILFLIVLLTCIMGIYLKGKNRMTSADSITFRVPDGITAVSDNNGRTVTYENKQYQRRTGTTNLLLIGKNPDHTFSTVVANFDPKSKFLRFMPVPAALLAIDYRSAMNYSDIAGYVSEFLCGLPIQGYMVLDMQVMDTLMETQTDQVLDNLQMQKLAVFTGEVVDNTSENWMIPSKIFGEFQESFSTNLKVADLSYVYTLFVVCNHSPEYEFTEPMDINMVFQQLLNTFYDEKQE